MNYKGAFMKIRKGLLAISILIPLGVGLLSSVITRGAMSQFDMLNQPSLSPPAWLFPVVWTILYILMGVSAYVIKTSKGTMEEIQEAMKNYRLQLLVNFLWPTFFFNFGWYLFSFFWLLLLWVLVVIMIRKFYTVSKMASYLNIPYLLWLTFAAYLNWSVWLLNR